MGIGKHRTTIASTDLGESQKSGLLVIRSDLRDGRNSLPWLDRRNDNWHMVLGVANLRLSGSSRHKGDESKAEGYRFGQHNTASLKINSSYSLFQICQATPRFHLISDTDGHPRSVLLAVSPASTFIPEALNSIDASAALHIGLC